MQYTKMGQTGVNYVCTCVFVFVFLCVHICSCVYIYISECVVHNIWCMRGRACVCIYACIYISECIVYNLCAGGLGSDTAHQSVVHNGVQFRPQSPNCIWPPTDLTGSAWCTTVHCVLLSIL